jgi:transposase
LAKLGYSRDGKRGTPQIVYGLLCDRPGRPIAIEVFEGSLHDDQTLPSQIDKLKTRFGLKTVIVVCDRGMVTKANLQLMSESDGVGWITALKAPQIKALVTSGALQLSLFDQTNLAEIEAPQDYPGERLVVCRNPLVAAERARKREDLLAATERGLAEIAQRVGRGTLSGADQIGLAVGPALKRYRMKKHFAIQITDTSFAFARKIDQIEAEAALDGFYVLRTNAPADELASVEVVRAYKGLEQVERAFGTFKGPELQIRPIHHRLADRVKAHALLCLLAYYLTWHLREAWAPLLFKDQQPPTAPDPVAKAIRSPAAQRKAQTKRTANGQPCHSYRSLIAELATQTQNTIRLPGAQATFDKLAEPTPLQAHALDLATTAPVVA